MNEKGDAPATCDDVTQYIKKQFDGKLTQVELDEIALDEGSFTLSLIQTLSDASAADCFLKTYWQK